jgi:hypothetical protein
VAVHNGRCGSASMTMRGADRSMETVAAINDRVPAA